MATQKPIANGEKTVTKDDQAVARLIDTVKESLPSETSSQVYDRAKLREAAHKLTLALETPGETVQRVAYYPMHTTIVRTANRLNLLSILVNSRTPQSSTELAQTVGADPLLLRRILRFLVATGMIGEADVDRYEATNITRNLAVPSLEAGINHSYDIVGYATMALPDFLQRTRYQNPTDPKHCAFQDAFHTEDDLFEWFPKHPEALHDFNVYMTAQREGRSNWLDFYPLERTLLDGFSADNDDAVMFVDVGGALGHEIEAIKTRFPDLPGKFILQDLPATIKQALPVPGMQAMAHDFFTEQPIKGAKCYYLRNVLHDWPDTPCHTILRHLAAAMTPRGYSKILLNEMVLPDKGASLVAAQRDITMMSVCGAMERTERQWREMAREVGLVVEGIWTDEEDMGAESVLVLGRG